ncbi:MAG TPA: hypothetical protein VFS59_13420 [Gemmatimonadaceae bacterium]|nr:hypothetical protein [Gemmatimonadaceae bacterium]
MSETLADAPVTNAQGAGDTLPGQSLWHRRPVLRVLVEVALIATGVFLGLAGDAWREREQKREAARASLRRFRAEVAANRAAVAAVRDYHVTALASVRAYLDKPNKARNTADVQIQGLRWVTFEHSAWDIALATQALAYIDGDLAHSLSRLYSAQQFYSELTSGMAQSMYQLHPEDNFDAFAYAVFAFFGDLTAMEPKLIAMYDELLPTIDRALGADRVEQGVR